MSYWGWVGVETAKEGLSVRSPIQPTTLADFLFGFRVTLVAYIGAPVVPSIVLFYAVCVRTLLLYFQLFGKIMKTLNKELLKRNM